MLFLRKAGPLFVSLIALLPVTASAWISTGHMVVASIAYRNLKPKVKAQVDALLQVGGDDKTRDFYGASAWADDTKTRENGPWHYIDNYFRSDGKPAQNKPDTENVVWAINKFEAVLADKTAAPSDRADALRYIIHFVGDIHQPLHCVSRESDEMPQGDAGGNRFRIQGVPGMDMRHPNLHLLWDFACGLYGDVPRPLTADGKAAVDSVAQRCMKDFPLKSLRAVHDLRPVQWMSESVGYAQSFVYGLPEGSQPSSQYLMQGQAICEERLALAGYRLAEVLNNILS